MAPRFAEHTSRRPSIRDRWPILLRVPFSTYGHAVAWMSEYVSTTFFFFLSLSGERIAWTAAGQQTMLPLDLMQLLYSSLVQGFAFAVSSWAFFRVTSGLFNPAITIGMCMIKSLSWIRGVWILLAQFMGALTGAGIVAGLLDGPVLPTMQIGRDVQVSEAFGVETLLTMAFVFLVFLLASERHKGVLLAPIALGLALFTVSLCGMLYSGGSFNPARAFAIAAVAHDFPGYHWIYWLGPAVGTVMAVLLHEWVRQLEVETADAKHRVPAEADEAAVVPSNPSPAESNRAGHQLEMVPEQEVEKSNIKETKPSRSEFMLNVLGTTGRIGI